jgi:hypothetical protein
MTEQSGRRLQASGDIPWPRPYQSLLHPADPSKLGDGTLNQPLFHSITVHSNGV